MHVLHVSCKMADGQDEERQSVSLTPTQLSKAKDAIEILYLTSAGKEPSNRGSRPTDRVVNPGSSGAAPGPSSKRTEEGIISINRCHGLYGLAALLIKKAYLCGIFSLLVLAAADRCLLA